MTDQTLIADLVRAGVDAGLVGRVAAALSGTVRDKVRDIIREHERVRKREQRKRLIKSSGKQTMSALKSDAESRKNVPDKEGNDDLTNFFPADHTASKRRTENKKESQAKRGTRLIAGQQISEADWQFARDLGQHDSAIKAMWVEFVDYWIGVPGQRGIKRDWAATWRNRVRFKSEKSNGHSNGGRHDPRNKSAVDALDRLQGTFGRRNNIASNQDSPVFLPPGRLRGS